MRTFVLENVSEFTGAPNPDQKLFHYMIGLSHRPDTMNNPQTHE